MSDIDLAPNHKIGLSVHSPLLLSPTAIGFGDVLPRGVQLAAVGAVVVGPVSAQGRGYVAPATLVELDGGGVLALGTGFSCSTRRAVARYGAAWARLGCPVIVQLVDATAAELAQSARGLAHMPGVAGVEWSVPATVTPTLLAEGVRALTQTLDAPIWVKLPLENAEALAARAVAAGAVGLVIGQPPQGAIVQHDPVTDAAVIVHGALYGPPFFALTLRTLTAIAATQPGCALIACGSVHTPAHVQQARVAGAHAVQIDAAWWREPGLPV